jgi:uroporphyrinogen decarboxylase
VVEVQAMTDRERFMRIMTFDPVDRVPNYELALWSQTYDRWLAEGLPCGVLYQNWFDGEPYFGLDRRAFAPIDVRMLPGFEPEVLEETDRYIVRRGVEGIVTRALKEGTVRGMRASMDQYIGHPVTDRASFRALKRRYDPSSPVRYPQWWDAMVRAWRDRDCPLCLLTNGSAGLYSQLRSWCGTEGISYLFYDDPALVEEMVEFNVDFIISVTARARRDIACDYFNFFEDFAGKGGPLVSPDLFNKFLLPGYKRIVDELRATGITSFWLDSDGDPRVLIPLMIEAGITCLWPLEIAAEIDPMRIRREYGRSLALAGGIDKRELAKGRTEIDREIERRMPLVETGGYIPHLDHSVPPDISLDNFRYYLERKRRLLGG